MSDHSVTRLVEAVQAGDGDAAAGLWQRYYPQLVKLAAAKMRNTPKTLADEEDIAAQAFASFCRRAADGYFPSLGDRTGLWRLLIVIAERKALNQQKHAFRKKNQAKHDSAISGDEGSVLDSFSRELETPELAASLADEFESFLRRLPDDRHRRVAVLKLEGHSNHEIAGELGCSLSSVERSLRKVRSLLWDPGD